MSRRAKLHPIDEHEFERRYGRGFSLSDHETTSISAQ
jgi:hypothetical protein